MCVGELLAFSRLQPYCFKKYHDLLLVNEKYGMMMFTYPISTTAATWVKYISLFLLYLKNVKVQRFGKNVNRFIA